MCFSPYYIEEKNSLVPPYIILSYITSLSYSLLFYIIYSCSFSPLLLLFLSLLFLRYRGLSVVGSVWDWNHLSLSPPPHTHSTIDYNIVSISNCSVCMGIIYILHQPARGAAMKQVVTSTVNSVVFCFWEICSTPWKHTYITYLPFTQ